VTISKHALEQYMIKVFSITNLSNVKEKTKQKAIKAIEENVKKGIEIELSKKESTIRLLNNECVQANYIWNKSVLYVLIDNCVVTCYPFKESRIGKKLSKIDK
jgi:hypothetical protein